MLNGLIVGSSCRVYYLNNKLHREDGPAIEYANGNKSYYLNDLLHREDGPAIDDLVGFKSYCLEGRHYYEQDYYKEIKKRKSLNYILSNIKKELLK
jgi:hypothetical protein